MFYQIVFIKDEDLKFVLVTRLMNVIKNILKFKKKKNTEKKFCFQFIERTSTISEHLRILY